MPTALRRLRPPLVLQGSPGAAPQRGHSRLLGGIGINETPSSALREE
jgi:hypothetical protein